MADYVVAQASVLIVPSLKKFNKQLQIELARAQKLASPVTIDVEANTKKFVAEGLAAKKLLEKDPVNVKFRVVDATKQITEIRHRYEDLVRETKKGLLLQLKVVGLSVLPQLAQGLASANASIVELSRSALLLPGILSGVASSIASVVTGLGGVSDAFKEYGEAQKNAAQEGLKARNSARNVKNAYRDLGRSVKDAKRNLEDLNAELRGAPLDEADAIIRLAEAQAEAADKFQKSGLQQQKDLIDLKRAENELVEVRLRNSRLVEDAAEANAKGVAGADGVREATERLAKAQDEAATRTTKLNDSLKEISPNAQSFVQAVTGMSDQWSAFKNVVQDRLFEGLDREITQLAQVSLPTLERGLGSIASALNDNVRTAMQVLQTPTNQGFFERIFGDTAEAQKNLSAAFDPFVDSFLRLSAVGTSFLPRLVEGLTDLLTRFDNFIVRAEGDGSLNNWIERGIDDLNALGNSIINLGSMLTSLSDAFTDSGGKTFFEALESGTGKLADFLRSPEGQDGLKRFFQEAREEFDKWQPLLSTIPGLLSNLSDAGQAFADVLLPFLSGASRLLSENQLLVDALLYSFIAWKGIFPILKGVSNGVGLVNSSITFFKTQVDDAGNKTSGFRTKVNDLSKSLFSAGGLTTAAFMAATWIGTNLVKAHDEAAAAAERQKQDLDALKRSLDDVTGAATDATRELVLQNTMEGVNEATKRRYGDVFAGLDPKQARAALDSVVAGDREGALAAVGGGVQPDAVRNTPFWRDYGPALEQGGITSEVLTKALNGDPDAKSKFEKWWSDQGVGFGPIEGAGLPVPFGSLIPDNVKRGLAKSGVVDTAPTLLDLQDQLSPEDQLKVARAGEINSAVTNLEKSQDQIRTNNERGFGRWRLKPNSPFDDLGVVVGPQVNADGGGLVTRSAPADGPQADAFRDNGVTFRPDGPDRYIVSIAPDKFKNYFDEYASGGLISGPGSGTSDSILARLSNGEFVVNAAATQRHLPLLEQINGGKLPGFAPGGPVQPKPPVVPDVASAYDNFLTGGGSPYPISAPEPKRDQTRGISVVGEYAGKALGSVGRFFKSALGIGDPPEGYGETSVATIKPNKPNMGLPSTGQALSNAAGFLLPSEFGETRTARIVPNSVKYPKAPPKPKNPLSDLGQPFSADAMPSSGGSGLPQVLANVSNASLEKPWGTDPATGKPWTGSAPKPSAPTPKTSKGSSAPPVKQAPPPQKPTGAGTSGTSGTSAAGVPHTGSGARPGDYHDGRVDKFPGPGPSSSASVDAISQGTGMPPAVVQQAVPPAVLNSPVGPALAQAAFPVELVPGVTPEVNFGAQEAAKYGLRVTSGLREYETGSFHSTGQAGDYSNQEQFGPPTPEMTAFAQDMLARYAPYIDELIYSGVSQNVYRGKLVPAIDMEGSPYNTAQAGYHGDHVHIAWKPGALAALTAGGMSPSNMMPASTPTGIQLPQLSYAPGASILSQLIPGMSNTGGGMPSGQEMAANYMEYVADAWQDILLDLSQNLGNIAVSFIGGLTGLDFGPLMNVGNNIIDGLGGGLESLTAERDSGDGMGSIPAVDDILNSLGGLPPEYQKYAEQAIAANPNQAYEVLQTLNALANGQGGSVQYNPAGGAEQWRSTVRRILAEVAPRYGITNLKAWEDDIIGQINLESRGDPNAENLNDSDGKGGTQQVFGLGQFHPDTFRNHNVIGGDISDPIAQIYAMIDYLASPKYGVVPGGGVNWKGFGWRNGMGYAAGGKITGPGSGSSDSIIARVSNGEFLVRAPMAQKHMGLLQAINANKLPGFADGMMWPINAPAPLTPPPPANAPPPPPSPIPPAPAGPAADALAGQPSAPAPVAEAQGAGDADSTALQEIGSALGGIGSSLTGNGGAEAPAGGSPTGDPRSVLGSAPQNLDHNKPAVSQGIQQAAGAISSAVSTAMSAAAAAGTGGAGGGAGAAASAPITALIQAGGSAVAGAVNILSSLGVGTLTRSQTSGAYGTPLTPKGVGDQPYQGPGVVNNWNGGVHTSNNEEFFKIQQRRELQNASPYLPQR